jgi:hypothetical protein
MKFRNILLITLLLLQYTAWPNDKKISIVKLKAEDIQLTLGGELEEDYFFYQRIRTLSADFYDQNDFYQHKLQLDLNMTQGEKKHGKPTTEAGIRLTNYVIWQQNNFYTPFGRDNSKEGSRVENAMETGIENIRSMNPDTVLHTSGGRSKTLMPLIYVEDAWFKLNIDTFWHVFNKNPTFFKIGFFEYEAGRGISLGYHNDLAVEYLGWPGQSGFNHFPQMPPGFLFHSDILKDLALEIYFMKWRENDATLDDVTAPARSQRLGFERTERGTNKDRNSWVFKFQYAPKDQPNGLQDVYLEPYWVYTRAPDQIIEFDTDASSHLHTLGTMFEFKKNNFDVNVEIAGQAGHQDVFGIDRNVKMLTKDSQTGATTEVFSHIVIPTPNCTRIPGNLGRQKVPVGSTTNFAYKNYIPQDDYSYIVNSPKNRNINMQGKAVDGISFQQANNTVSAYNSNMFGNARFRKPYKLNLNGFMALADIGYNFDKYPFRIAGSVGHISGDNYPYNEEVDKTYRGFIPLRSRYQGYDVQSTLIFDRLVIPRPLNICPRTMYAFNNLKDVSNLELLGVGGTYYPFKNRSRALLTANFLFFWEDALLYKWDKNGHHPDPAIEAQIAYDRARLGFRGVYPTYQASSYYGNPPSPAPNPTNKGWLSTDTASRFLGAEIDLKGELVLIKECRVKGKFCMFIPGQLYKDLDGQPNELTRYVDTQDLSHYESLGHKFAFAFNVELDYVF